MSAPTVFISYSHKDEIWKDRLRPHLGMLEQAGRLTIWDDRKIDAGATWYPEIKGAMEQAAVTVCLISADYLASTFCVKEEIPYLLKRRESEGMLLLPVLIRPCLWEAIDWLKAIQMLPRDGKSIAVDFRDDSDTPFRDVARRVNSFLETPKREAAMPSLTSKWLPPAKVDVDRLPVTGAELFGRQKELKMLDEAWESGTLNVVSLVAYGGVGKSTLVNKWREQMAADNYRGARRVFAWSFYSQGTGDRVTSADIFIAEALKWFGDPEMAKSNASAWDKGGRLAELVRQEKTLLLLDGMEPLQSYLTIERGKIKDPALEVLVTELARENSGLCVITTRENIADLSDFPTTVQQTDLEQISAEAGRALLRVGGVQGTDAELEQAAHNFGLHALALNLLAAYLHDIPGHHISHAAEIPDLDVPLEKGKYPRRVMAAFANRFGDSAEADTLHILGMFSSPANKEEIAAVRAAPPIPGLTEHLENISDATWLQVVNHLRRMKLILPESSHRSDTLDCHPLLREHFGEQLKATNPAAWCEGNNRLYEWYKTSAKELPNTIQEMAPLYAAVLHGCQAEQYQEALREVYLRRIQRGEECFNWSKLGAFGAGLSALSGFFDSSWHRPIAKIDKNIKSFILNEVGVSLRALGRLSEAAQPMQASLDANITDEKWRFASVNALNLSELNLLVGDVICALNYAHQCLELACFSDDIKYRLGACVALGSALHQAGQLAEAEAAFQEAEELQKEFQPGLPLLYSVQGFRYCDLLLDKGKVQEVLGRAIQTFELAKRHIDDHLSISLDGISIARVYLLQSQHRANYPISNSFKFLNDVVDNLRQAGLQDHLSRGLRARAEYYRVTGDLNKSQKDLDEAFSISTRGGMGLHLADCHLEYARLYLAHPSLRGGALPPKQSPLGESEIASQTALAMTEKACEHLKTAKAMIEKMGYHRRDKEVEELEELLAV